MLDQYQPLRLTDKPLDVRFTFVDRCNQSSKERPDREGFIQFTIHVAGQQYGPYQTAFRTYYQAWVTRQGIRPTQSARIVHQQTAHLSSRLADAWKTFDHKRVTVTAEMLLQRAGYKVFGVAEGGALYVI